MGVPIILGGNSSESDSNGMRRGARTLAIAISVTVVAFTMSAASVLPAGAAQTSGNATSGAPTSNVRSFMTLYGYVDNSPPGTGIAHPCIHSQAGGTGTYADPITFATDVAELGWCTVIYVPYMQRYFIHEDECSQCDRDWSTSHLYRFDMWAGGDASSLKEPERRALLRCERTWTRGDSPTDPANPTILINPQPDLPVTKDPIFSAPTSCWNPITISNPGKQTTYLNSGPVRLPIAASDTSADQTLKFAAVGLPNGVSIDDETGLISGTPAIKQHSRATITVSDEYNSASTTFVWVVKNPPRR
jgi:hypothetical protein